MIDLRQITVTLHVIISRLLAEILARIRVSQELHRLLHLMRVSRHSLA